MRRGSFDFVYFDLGNVLVHFDYRLSCRRLCELAGVAEDRILTAAYTGPLAVEFETGRVTSVEYTDRVARQLGLKMPLDDLGGILADIFWLNREIVPLVASLAQAGIPLGVLSNTCPTHWEYVTSRWPGLLSSFFAKKILSFEVGAMKPNQEIYRRAAHAADCEPSRIFFTDDRVENIEGARRSGFQAHLFTTVAALVHELRRLGCQFAF